MNKEVEVIDKMSNRMGIVGGLFIILVIFLVFCTPKEKKSTCEILLDQRDKIDRHTFGDQKALIESNERMLRECNCLK